MNAGQAAGLLLTFARRGEQPLIEQAIGRLRQEGVGGVFAVGTAASLAMLRQAGAEETVTYGDGHTARTVVRELRRRRPRVAAIIHFDPTLSGHLKLEALAFLSGAKRIWRIAPEGLASGVGRGALGWSVLTKGAGGCGRLLLGAALCAIAFLCLRLRQMTAGGVRAGRV